MPEIQEIGVLFGEQNIKITGRARFDVSLKLRERVKRHMGSATYR